MSKITTNQPTLSDQLGMVHNKMLELVENTIQSRQDLIKKFADPRRDIYADCGYDEDIEIDQYIRYYTRHPIASRVVNLMPEECWAVAPEVTEQESKTIETEFEKDWEKLHKKVRGTSWYDNNEGSPIWEMLKRVDTLSRIGQYGVLLIGVNDGKALNEPIDSVVKDKPPTERSLEVTFMRPFHERQAQIATWVTDKSNRRYGQPEYYNLYFYDRTEGTQATGIGVPNSSERVHWSRVVHIADNLQSSDLLGIPAMYPVWNRLVDLEKLYAASAEGYWQAAFPGLSLEFNPNVNPEDYDMTEVVADMKDQLEAYQNSLQRYLAIAGMTVNTIAPGIQDPSSMIEAQVDAICIRLGVPKRIFVGSERGELSSTQDERTWTDRVSHRQNNYLSPRVIGPFVDRLILMGILTPPKGYQITWPDMHVVSDSEKQSLAGQRLQNLALWSEGLEARISPEDMYTEFLGFDLDTTKRLIKNAEEHKKSSVASQPDDNRPGVPGEGGDEGEPDENNSVFENDPDEFGNEEIIGDQFGLDPDYDDDIEDLEENEDYLDELEDLEENAFSDDDEIDVDDLETNARELYHTTTFKGLQNILKQKKLQPKSFDGFVSLSETPFTGDISGNDVTLIFDKSDVSSHFMPVKYTEQWAKRYPEQAAYIAGEGWREQFLVDDWIDASDLYDEDGEESEDYDRLSDEAYRLAEVSSFLFKKNEREWISKREGRAVPLGKVKAIKMQRGSKQQLAKILDSLSLDIDII